MPVPALPRLSPTAFRRLAVLAVVTLAVVVVTGGAVRLTGSGLGCPTWPRCTTASYVAPASYHALVEFVNRMITVAVGIGVFATAAGSLLLRPRRRDLIALSWGLVTGFLAQAVIGGLSVVFKLAPGWVIPHFLVSMLLVWDALVLLHRADPAWAPSPPAVRREVAWLGRLLAAAAGLTLVLGTVVTGTGPHAGAPDVHRLSLPLVRVTQLHADAALFLTGLVVATVLVLRIVDAPGGVRRRGRVLIGLLAAQVAVGYTQYFLNLPAQLVLVHVALATALWMAVIWLNLGFHRHPVSAGAGVPADPGRPAPDVNVVAADLLLARVSAGTDPRRAQGRAGTGN